MSLWLRRLHCKFFGHTSVLRSLTHVSRGYRYFLCPSCFTWHKRTSL